LNCAAVCDQRNHDQRLAGAGLDVVQTIAVVVVKYPSLVSAAQLWAARNDAKTREMLAMTRAVLTRLNMVLSSGDYLSS